MTAKEKMLRGEYYNSWEPELLEPRERAKSILFEFNQINPLEREKRETIIRELFHSVGENPWIESPFNCDYGSNITVGDNFYANINCCILDCAKVTIGNNVLFAPNVSIYTPEHCFDPEERRAGYEHALPVTIGDDVWICGSVTITAGVTIGKNTIIGAGSVVTKDIPEGVIAAGVPARVIRKITPEDRVMQNNGTG